MSYFLEIPIGLHVYVEVEGDKPPLDSLEIARAAVSVDKSLQEVIQCFADAQAPHWEAFDCSCPRAFERIVGMEVKPEFVEGIMYSSDHEVI